MKRTGERAGWRAPADHRLGPRLRRASAVRAVVSIYAGPPTPARPRRRVRGLRLRIRRRLCRDAADPARRAARAAAPGPGAIGGGEGPEPVVDGPRPRRRGRRRGSGRAAPDGGGDPAGPRRRVQDGRRGAAGAVVELLQQGQGGAGRADGAVLRRRRRIVAGGPQVGREQAHVRGGVPAPAAVASRDAALPPAALVAPQHRHYLRQGAARDRKAAKAIVLSL